MDIKVLAYGQGPLSLVEEQALVEQFKRGEEQSIEVQIAPRVMFRTSDVEKGIVGLQMYVEYVHQEQKIISYGFVLTLQVKEWAEFDPGSKSEEEIRSFFRPIWEKTFIFASGALVSRLQTEPLQQLVLSSLHVNDEFMNLVRVEREE